MRYRIGFFGRLMTLLGAALLLAGCGQVTIVATVTPSESQGVPTEEPTGTPSAGAATPAPGDTATSPVQSPSPQASTPAAPTLAVRVGTSVPPTGSVLSPPLRDITPSGPPTPGPPMTPDSSGTVIVGMDDAGREVELNVGDTLQLAFPTTYDWTVTLTNTAILTAVGTPGGGQSKYKAAQAGTSALLAAGDPACRKSQPPCEMPSRLVRMEIVVR